MEANINMHIRTYKSSRIVSIQNLFLFFFFFEENHSAGNRQGAPCISSNSNQDM